jgi:hypothetical protein
MEIVCPLVSFCCVLETHQVNVYKFYRPNVKDISRPDILLIQERPQLHTEFWYGNLLEKQPPRAKKGWKDKIKMNLTEIM